MKPPFRTYTITQRHDASSNVYLHTEVEYVDGRSYMSQLKAYPAGDGGWTYQLGVPPWYVVSKSTEAGTWKRLSIAEVKRRFPMFNVIFHYLNAAGKDIETWSFSGIPHYKNWVYLRCPFHDDKSPSASIDLKNQRFYCHGPCDFSGDVIDLVRWREGYTKLQDVVTFLETHVRI
jgi:hypothetical protein